MARDGLDLAEIFDQIKIGPLSRGMGFGTWASLSVLGVSFGTLRRLLGDRWGTCWGTCWGTLGDKYDSATSQTIGLQFWISFGIR